MNLLLNRLNQFQASNDLLGIHCDATETTRFQLGWVVDVNESAYALISVDEDGSFDAVSIGFIDDIVRLSYDTPYIRSVKASASFARSIEAFDIRDITADFNLILSKVKGNRQLISLTDRNWGLLTGIVQDFDSEYVEVEEISRAGDQAGFELISRDDILRLELFGSFAGRVSQIRGSDAPGVAQKQGRH